MINIYDYPQIKKRLDGMIKGFYRKNSNYFKKDSIDLEDFYQEVYLKLLKTKVYHEDAIESYIILSAYCHMKNIWKKAVKKYNVLGKALVNADIKCFENIKSNESIFDNISSDDYIQHIEDIITQEFTPVDAFILCSFFVYDILAKDITKLIPEIFEINMTQRQVFYVIDKHKDKIKKLAEQSRKCCF